MSNKRNNTLLAVWAVVGVPVMFGLIYNLGYSDGTHWSAPMDFALFGLFIASGIAAIWFLSIRKLWVRIAACAAYAVSMSWLIAMIGLGVACSNGNCL